MRTKFNDAKVGDRCWSCNHGWGEITSVNITFSDPIEVTFEKGGEMENFENYEFCGSRVEDSLQTLFWDALYIDPPVKPVPVWRWVCQGIDLRITEDYFKDEQEVYLRTGLKSVQKINSTKKFDD